MSLADDFMDIADEELRKEALRFALANLRYTVRATALVSDAQVIYDYIRSGVGGPPEAPEEP